MCTTFVDFLIGFGEVVRIDVTGFTVIVAAGDGFLDFAADFARVMTVGPDGATMGFAAITRLAAGDGFLDFVADLLELPHLVQMVRGQVRLQLWRAVEGVLQRRAVEVAVRAVQ